MNLIKILVPVFGSFLAIILAVNLRMESSDVFIKQVKTIDCNDVEYEFESLYGISGNTFDLSPIEFTSCNVKTYDDKNYTVVNKSGSYKLNEYVVITEYENIFTKSLRYEMESVYDTD